MSFIRTRWQKKAQACGRLTKAEGPEGPIAPVVTTGGYSWDRRATFLSRVILAPGSHANLLCVVQTKKNSNCAYHPCAGTTLNCSASIKKQNLELFVSSLRRGHADLHCVLQTTDYTSRFVRDLRTLSRAWLQRGTPPGHAIALSRTHFNVATHSGGSPSLQTRLAHWNHENS